MRDWREGDEASVMIETGEGGTQGTVADETTSSRPEGLRACVEGIGTPAFCVRCMFKSGGSIDEGETDGKEESYEPPWYSIPQRV